ncbi:Aldo/keto reductase family protein [Paenibacillus sp. yr247]|uniref:aldo/keto reductase n=1 Tax=Paenibacillus sp. yr247 TaxID=1761880 RepID=UPI000885F338|nr:aldo/keto reductase [Paenibacillus sp. yr247]SDN03639.1 Aldo/keto reductase family protein [Paenibacillus sp. yr247]
MAKASMRWVLDNPNITCMIPGFKNECQIEDNLGTIHVPMFRTEELERLQNFYHDKVRDHIRGQIKLIKSEKAYQYLSEKVPRERCLYSWCAQFTHHLTLEARRITIK